MEKSRRQTLKLRLCEDESPPMQAIRLSTTLMSNVLANQTKYRSTRQGFSQSVHKLDLYVSVDYHLRFERRVQSVWSQCYEVLKEYRWDIRQQFGFNADSVFGRLTITPTFAEPFHTFLNDAKDTLALFESLCLRVHPEDHCMLDRLPDILPMYGLSHLELCRCTIAYGDLEKIVLHTQGLKTLSFEDVKMERDPPRVPCGLPTESITLGSGSSIPHITLTTPLFSEEDPPDLPAYWRVIDALPQIDDLRLTTSRLLGMPEIQSNLSRINTPIKRIQLRVTHFPGRDYHHEFLQLQTCLASMQNLIGFHMKIDTGGFDIEDDVLSQLELSSLNFLSTWALPPRCRLTSISFPIQCLPSDVLGTWEAHLASQQGEEAAQVDTNTKSQLRRLDFYTRYVGGISSSHLSTLLAFLKTQFPYVYYIGVGTEHLAEEWEKEFWKLGADYLAEEREKELWNVLRKQILLQLEKNRVGLALLDSRVDPPVPRGVWSHILANALAPPRPTPNDTNVDTTDRIQFQWTMKVPWSGIYCLVKELAERELLFVSPPAAAAADPIEEGRPRKQQRTI